MLEMPGTTGRRTTADMVFDKLHEEIVSLKLLPGTKLSEAEVARRFGVSRQPVRDAFTRLGNQDLLLIRPQRATEVRAFSMEQISHARFVRQAVELEVLRDACKVWDETCAAELDANLALQQEAVDKDQPERFHQLDYQFHKLICTLAGHPMAFETIWENKQTVNRLCVLSLTRDKETALLLDDHRELADALRRQSVEDATRVLRNHLTRLDDTIAHIHKAHKEYFA